MPIVTRLTGAAAALLVSLTAAGCYGSTEPASDVGATTATLHGRGTANAGPASVFFEYWPVAAPAERRTAPVGTVPAGASGPVAKTVSGLRPNAGYAYRLCASDASTPAAGTCAQTVSFRPRGNIVRVLGNAEASATEGGAFDYEDVGINAVSGPAGESPGGQGNFTLRNARFGTFTFGSFGSPPPDNVTCLHVAGNVAVVELENLPPPDSPALRFEAVELVDGGPGNPDGIAIYGPSTQVSGSDCAAHADLVTRPFTSGGVTIEQAPPAG